MEPDGKDGALLRGVLRAGESAGQSTEQLRLATQHLASIVEFSDDAIISKNLEGIVTSWNAGAKRLFGYSAAEMIGGPVTRLIPSHKQDEEPGIIARIRSGERIDHYETVRLHKNGKLIDVSLTVSPIKDADNRIIGASKIARDITEKKKTEAELLRRERQLKQAREELLEHARKLEQRVEERTLELRESNHQLETLVYSIAHDLRAPLRSMQAYSQILLDDYVSGLDETARHYARRIIHSAETMDALVLDLLSYGRIARSEMFLEPLALESVWKTALQQYEKDIGDKQARIETVPPLPRVMGNEVTLGQVLANLLGNALKFTVPETAPSVRFRTEERDRLVRIWIEDNGIGIDPEYHDRIFRIFERLQGQAYPGTGIGLSIVRKGIERMGGRSGVESTPGKGSRFWIELPAAGP